MDDERWRSVIRSFRPRLETLRTCGAHTHLSLPWTPVRRSSGLGLFLCLQARRRISHKWPPPFRKCWCTPPNRRPAAEPLWCGARKTVVCTSAVFALNSGNNVVILGDLLDTIFLSKQLTVIQQLIDGELEIFISFFTPAVCSWKQR